MRTMQCAMRASWLEAHRSGPKAEPSERAFCDKLRIFWGRDVDPVNGMDPTSVIAMGRNRLHQLTETLGVTAWQLIVSVDTRMVDKHGEEITVTGSWENLATWTIIDGEAVVEYPEDANARNVDQVRQAAAQLSRFPESKPQANPDEAA